MSNSMIRVTKELIEDLKVLKTVIPGTNNNIIHYIIKEELKKSFMATVDGYAAVGAVISGPSGNPVVIISITRDKVVFSDGTYVINGSAFCSSLKILSDSVEEFDGELFDV